MKALKTLARIIFSTLFWFMFFPFALVVFWLLLAGIPVIVAAIAAVILAFLVLLAAILLVASPYLYLLLVAYVEEDKVKIRKRARLPDA